MFKDTDKIRSLAAVSVLAWASAAAAQQPPDVSALRLSGFGTLGVLRADAPPGWGFRRELTQPRNDGGTRADIDSRLGLQANYRVHERFEWVGQLVLRDELDSARASDRIEWLYASFRPTPDITLRVGRTSADAFLLSDYRNVGFAYSAVRPTVEFYGLLSIRSVDGLDLARSWRAGDAQWRAKAFAGTGSLRIEGPAGQPDSHARIRSAWGGMLSREQDGLLLRATAARVRLEPADGNALAQLNAGLSGLQALPVPPVAAEAAALQGRLVNLDRGHLTYAALGASYESSAWLAAAELARATGEVSSVRFTTARLALGRRFGDFTLHGGVGRARSPQAAAVAPQWQALLTPLVGPQLAQQAQALGDGAAFAANASRVDQRSVSLGVRWDFHPQMALKMQWDRVRVGANGGVLWANATPQAARADVATLVLDFVF